MRKTLIPLCIALALSVSGCAATGALKGQATEAAQHGAFVADAQFALATTTDESRARELCAEIKAHKADRETAWENTKAIGGSFLRLGAAIGAVAGFPVAAAIDAVIDGADAVESFSAQMDAATKPSNERCARLSGG